MTFPRVALVGLLVLAAAASVGVALAGTGLSRGGGDAKRQLPDLDIVAPYDIQVAAVPTDRRTVFLLSFGSATENDGDGPLRIVAERESNDVEKMDARQVIDLSDGSTVSRPRVGTLTYVVDPTHQHWHLEPFMRYELRTAKKFRLVRPDVKTGFCLGDRYSVKGQRIGHYRTNCGLGETGLLSVEEGISVGFGDDYDPWRDGQAINLTGLRAGKYVLVHRVNTPRRLQELSYRNNASSALLRLSWPNGRDAKPRVKVLERCPDQARCGVPNKTKKK